MDVIPYLKEKCSQTEIPPPPYVVYKIHNKKQGKKIKLKVKRCKHLYHTNTTKKKANRTIF